MMLSYSAFKWTARLLGGVAAMGAFALAAGTANAAIITVTTDQDEFGTGPGCSLREAIQSANQNSDFGGCSGIGPYGADIIQFAPGIDVITLTITSPVGMDNDNNAYLDLDVVVDSLATNVFTLTIQGSSNAPVKVIRDYFSTPQFEDRIFDILPPTAGRPAGVRIAWLYVESGLAIGNEETATGTLCDQGGAGIRHRSGGLLEIERGTVSYNFANGNGGGICQDGGQLRVLNYTYIAKNTSKFYNGGGIYISGTADLTATLSQNEAQNGGGVYVSAGSTVNVNSTVNDNDANLDGGGFWNAGALTINGGSYNTNQAQNGGGIWNNGVLTITNAGVFSNTATQNGGGVYNENGGTVSISSAGVGPNNVADNGGGIWNNGVLTITSAGVTTNTASADGGGIYNASNGTATLTTAGVSDNQAPNGSGGGIYNDGTLNVTGSGVDANQAAFGGGIYNGLGGTVNVAGAQVNANSATQQGGGIFNNGTLDVNGARVNNNSAGQAGGGIYNQNGTAVIFNFSQVNGNMINQTGFFPAQGGGIWNGATLVSPARPSTATRLRQ